MFNKSLLRSIQVSMMVPAAIVFASQVSHASLIVNGTPNGNFDNNSTMVYTSDPTDPTVYASSGFALGTSGTSNVGSLTVNSGSFTINASAGSIIGQTGGKGTVTVNGGSLTITTTGGLLIGNANDWGTGSQGTINMAGGTFNITNTSTATDVFVGRDGAGQGRINVTGGLLAINTPGFTLTGGNFDGGTSGVVTLGAGNGVFQLTGLSTLTINNPTTSYFNFLSGSGGVLSINGYTQTQFNNLVTAGSIRLDGAVTTPSQFGYNSSGGQGNFQLVPEPGSWTLLAAGAVGLYVMNRRRREA